MTPPSLFRAARCMQCGHSMPPDLHLAACGICGSPWLDARYDLAALPADWPARVAGRPAGMWRYHELLPFAEAEPALSLGEGWTPLTRAGRLAEELGYGALWIKDERQQPTGSFKDRQAAATVRALCARGVDELVVASTGNAAVAYAAYCARAGIKLWVFLTSSVPAEKTRELALYGAEVIKITGTYDQAKEIAADFAVRRGIWYDRGAKAIPGKESMKTIAFEIVEQLGWRVPDWYVQAVSGGIGPLGVLKGFTELFEAGLTDRVPKLAIIQAAGCAPMARAWAAGAEHADPVEPDTLISVLATGDPGYAYAVLREADLARGGAMLAVDDGEAFRAMRRLARTEGISVEPAVSVAFAGLERLMVEGRVGAGETVVVNASGHTFSAEKHALEDRYLLHLEVPRPPDAQARPEGLVSALRALDEQVTTVVVIDDNPHDTRLISRLLQQHKRYRVFEAHNGPDGIDLVRQRRPDLVLLDLTLPEMDGFAILNTLKNDPRTKAIPVMIVTAKSLDPEERALLRQHSTSIWEKGTFSAAAMVRHVVSTLGGELERPDIPLTTTPRRIADGMIEVFGRMERRRILVIDGNTVEARLLRRLLEARQRYEVLEAHSGAQALAHLDGSPPDLVIMDLKLPDVDGAALLADLRGRDALRQVPVILMSPANLDPRRRADLASQADSVWAKETLDRSSLLAHVETILQE